jgi:hypothetical protein
MGARIRGHYRIDPLGRVEPITDVNALAKPFTLPLSVMQKKTGKRSHLIHVSVAGVILFSTGVSLMAALPQIQRMVIAAEASHTASQRQAYIHSHPQLEALLAKKH